MTARAAPEGSCGSTDEEPGRCRGEGRRGALRGRRRSGDGIVSDGMTQLRHEVERLSEVLRAFEAPVADELPSLRLMAHVLEDRRSQVVDKLDTLERSQVIVQVDGDDLPEHGLPAEVAALLLDGLQHGVGVLGAELSRTWPAPPDDDVVRAETALLLVAWDAGPPAELTLNLVRRPEEQLIDPATRTALLERVLHALVAGLDGGAAAATALAPLAEVVVARAITLRVTTVLPGGEAREGKLDRAAAQRLLAHDSGGGS